VLPAVGKTLLNGFVLAVGVSDRDGAAALYQVVNPVTDRRVQFRNCP